jgi:multiple sugar transport system ATP-binding protein
VSAIRLESVSKVYGGSGDAAVKDVNLTIGDGEFVILVGPSGCGKSTLLRMIVGLEEVTTGDVFVGDDRVTGKAPRDRNLAMVFQNYALYPHLTVFENIAFPLRLRKVSQSEVNTKVNAAAEMLELTEFLKRKPGQLSGGQRQRVAMGRALVRDAEAFLFDEPLSNLDAKLRGQMRTEIGRLQQRLGVTTVYVTHDQVEAMTLGDRVAVLRKGEIQQVASPRDLYEHPVNLFVAGFIGSPSMNLMPARVEGNKLHLPVAELELSPDLATKLEGRPMVIAGIRPEAFEVAQAVERHLRPFGAEFTAKVDVVEWLGSEQYAYIPFDSPVDVHKPLAQLAEEMDTEQLRTQIVVNLSADTPLKKGTEAKLWLDPRRMHLFDPDSGENLTNGSGVTVALPE